MFKLKKCLFVCLAVFVQCIAGMPLGQATQQENKPYVPQDYSIYRYMSYKKIYVNDKPKYLYTFKNVYNPQDTSCVIGINNTPHERHYLGQKILSSSLPFFCLKNNKNTELTVFYFVYSSGKKVHVDKFQIDTKIKFYSPKAFHTSKSTQAIDGSIDTKKQPAIIKIKTKKEEYRLFVPIRDKNGASWRRVEDGWFKMKIEKEMDTAIEERLNKLGPLPEEVEKEQKKEPAKLKKRPKSHNKNDKVTAIHSTSKIQNDKEKARKSLKPTKKNKKTSSKKQKVTKSDKEETKDTEKPKIDDENNETQTNINNSNNKSDTTITSGVELTNKDNQSTNNTLGPVIKSNKKDNNETTERDKISDVQTPVDKINNKEREKVTKSNQKETKKTVIDTNVNSNNSTQDENNKTQTHVNNSNDKNGGTITSEVKQTPVTNSNNENDGTTEGDNNRDKAEKSAPPTKKNKKTSSKKQKVTKSDKEETEDTEKPKIDDENNETQTNINNSNNKSDTTITSGVKQTPVTNSNNNNTDEAINNPKIVDVQTPVDKINNNDENSETTTNSKVVGSDTNGTQKDKNDDSNDNNTDSDSDDESSSSDSDELIKNWQKKHNKNTEGVFPTDLKTINTLNRNSNNYTNNTNTQSNSDSDDEKQDILITNGGTITKNSTKVKLDSEKKEPTNRTQTTSNNSPKTNDKGKKKNKILIISGPKKETTSLASWTAFSLALLIIVQKFRGRLNYQDTKQDVLRVWHWLLSLYKKKQPATSSRGLNHKRGR